MDSQICVVYESLSDTNKLLVKRKIDELLEEQRRKEQEQETKKNRKG